MSAWHSRYWSDYTSEHLARLPRERLIAVLPVAATEQHGPHMPLSTDQAIVEGIVRATVPKLPDALPVLFLPTSPFGKSNEHARYPGTITLSATTLLGYWSDIATSVARAGVRKFVLFNGHGGQMNLMDVLVRDLRERLGIMVVGANWYTLGLPTGLFTEHEQLYGIHAGDIETSLMLALAPADVRMEHARNFPSLAEALATGNRFLGITTRGKLGWQSQDLNPDGACGDARLATADKGHAVIEFVSDRFVELLHEVDRFDPARLRNEPSWR